MEKIFQIPFHLKDASNEGVKYMLGKLCDSEETEDPSVTTNTKITEDSTEASGDLILAGDTISRTVEIAPTNHTLETTVSYPKSLILSKREIEIMQELSPVIGNNPRALKRFVNVYRIIRAHENYKDGRPVSEEKDFIIILFLLAFSIGSYKKLLPSFKAYIEDDRNAEDQMSSFLAPHFTTPTHDHIKHKLDVIMSDTKLFHTLQHAQMSTFREHYAFIRRFTFENSI